MKKIFLIGIFAILMGNCLSQAFLTQFPEIQRTDKDLRIDRTIATDETGFYVTSSNKNEYFIEKYSKNGNLVYSVKTKYRIKQEVTDGKFLILFSDEYTREFRKRVLSYQKLNMNKGEITNSEVIDEYEVPRGEDADIIELLPSPDNSKLLFFTLNNSGGRKLVFRVFDIHDLKKLWTSETYGTASDWPIKMKNYLFDNNGNFYHFVSNDNYLEDDEKGKKALDDSTCLEIRKFNTQNSRNESIKIILKAKMVVQRDSYQMIFNHKGEVIVSAMVKDYSFDDKKVNNQKIGFLYSLIDGKKNRVINSFIYNFSEDVNKKLTYSKFLPSNNEYGVNQIVELNNHVYIVAEDKFNRTNSYNFTDDAAHGSSSVKSFTTHADKELIVCKIDSTGNVNWNKIIPKCQFVNLESGISYQFLASSNSLNFIYVENKDNETISDFNNYDFTNYKVCRVGNGCNTVAVELNENGNISKRVIYRNDDLIFRPQFDNKSSHVYGVNLLLDAKNFTLDEKTLLVYFRDKGREKFGTVTFR